ncbi:carbohydrate-binding protein [Notoacmeibacter marinus]|uniref:Carbohydrate-binding protein n=1 Tax=Notoacmeibacter marinus TaxID=1876515 RepID=A0A231UY49_9HYPH|nr:nitrous oxide reductase family maturation protein NosD [Notoacmeibacter marinus]OXT00804.1 carbohydrate-binding protein [Notoacmeibacter marinus]
MKPAAAILVAFVACFPAVTAHAAEIVVEARPGALAAALETTASGDVLRLSPGAYKGPIVIERPLTLRGEGAHIEGPGTGTVIVVDAPDVTVSSLRVTGSGSSHETLDSGIKLTQKAARAVIEDNIVTGNLHGIDVHGAADAQVRRNTITGRDDHRMNARGNGIYIWNAPGVVVEDNSVRLGRDGIFVNTSHNDSFYRNRFSELRFAIHFMYANGAEIAGNVSTGNHLGYAVMYSRHIRMSGNVSDGDRDHGIMLNYANDAAIERNLVRDGGKKCLFMYNANRNRIADNRFERCPIGIHFTAGSERNAISGNAFIGNRTQVKYVGSKRHDWSEEGRGNYWSDHAAFDIDGDGIADQPFRPNDRMDEVLWTQPAAHLLVGSPAVQLIRWAQREFPALLPGGVVDTAPLMQPVPLNEGSPS